MSAKKEKEKQHKHEGHDDDENPNAIPQWATHRIMPVDDPFHDDFEVEIQLKDDIDKNSSEGDG